MVMRRSGWLSALAACCIIAGTAPLSLAQDREERPLAPRATKATKPTRVRIALVNMAQVIKNCHKIRTDEDQILARAEFWRKKIDGIAAKAKECKAKYTPGTSEADKEAIEKQLRQLQLEYQDADDAAKKDLTEIKGKVYQRAFLDVEEMVSLVAREYDYELVLYYQAPVTQTEYHGPEYFHRALLQPCVVPIYVTPGMDISDFVVTKLNAKYHGTAAAPANSTAHK